MGCDGVCGEGVCLLGLVVMDVICIGWWVCVVFVFQAEDGIRDLVRSRGLGDVYKRQVQAATVFSLIDIFHSFEEFFIQGNII